MVGGLRELLVPTHSFPPRRSAVLSGEDHRAPTEGGSRRTPAPTGRNGPGRDPGGAGARAPARAGGPAEALPAPALRRAAAAHRHCHGPAGAPTPAAARRAHYRARRYG